MDIVGQIIVSKGGDVRANLLEAMDVLKEDGWTQIDEDCKPYVFDLLPQLMPELNARGFTRVNGSCFKIGERNYVCCTRRVAGEFRATDKPEDFVAANRDLMSRLVERLKEVGSTHIFSVTVARLVVLGYLSKTVSVFVRSAKVRPVSLD